MYFDSLIKGQLGATFDINLVQTVASDLNTKIVFVGDSAGYENVIRMYNMIVGSILMPDYPTMEALINGDTTSFHNMYYSLLETEVPRMFFATLFTALYQGKNVMIYFPQEAKDLQYPYALLSYIAGVYGIQAAIESVRFQLTPAIVNAACVMYNFNLIYPNQFIVLSGDYFTKMLPKLIMDMGMEHILGDQQKEQSFAHQIKLYQNNMLQSGKYLTKPFMREG